NEGEAATKKVEVESAMAELKKLLEGADYAGIKSATTKLSEVSQQLGAALYAANASSAEAPKGDDGVEDAEIIDESK
ncbi:MAG: molecular chaperone DnaK, partial [Actinobacteria bacterium]|nr:molecular chaperone DnaK [Actinomycetota bacterium]